MAKLKVEGDNIPNPIDLRMKNERNQMMLAIKSHFLDSRCCSLVLWKDEIIHNPEYVNKNCTLKNLPVLAINEQQTTQDSSLKKLS